MNSRYTLASDATFLIEGKEHRLVFNTLTCKLAAVETRLLELSKCEGVDAQIENSRREALAELGIALGARERDNLQLKAILSTQQAANESLEHLSLVIMPTSNCNFGCAYCGQSHRPLNMSPAIRQRLLSRVEAKVDQVPAGGSLSVNWFGGEPLLGYKALIDIAVGIGRICEGRSIKWTSSMPTNGTLLNRQRAKELYLTANLRGVEVTLDGPQEIHDKSRPQKISGKKNYRLITQNLADIAADHSLDDLAVSLRVNVHEGNIDHVPRLIESVASTVPAPSRFSFNVVPVYDWGSDEAEGKVDRAAFASWQLEIYELLERHDFRYSLFPTKPVGSVCTATRKTSEVITAQGAIFTCTEEPLAPALDPERSVGHLVTIPAPAIRPKGMYDDWVEQGIAAGVSECSSCPILPICGGACPKQWMDDHIPCPPWKYNFPERLTALGNRLGLTMVNAV